MVTIRLEGSEELQARLRNMSAEVRDEVADVIDWAGFTLRNDVIQSIKNGPASGRVYTHYFWTDANKKLRRGRKRNKPHQASAPGEAPMSDTGQLSNNIYHRSINDLTATVGTKLAYGRHLEYGTIKMAARPFLRPAVERLRVEFNRRLEAAVTGATR